MSNVWTRGAAAAALAAAFAAATAAPAHAQAVYLCAVLLGYDESTGDLGAGACEGEGSGPGVVSVLGTEFECEHIEPGMDGGTLTVAGTGCTY